MFSRSQVSRRQLPRRRLGPRRRRARGSGTPEAVITRPRQRPRRRRRFGQEPAAGTSGDQCEQQRNPTAQCKRRGGHPIAAGPSTAVSLPPEAGPASTPHQPTASASSPSASPAPTSSASLPGRSRAQMGRHVEARHVEARTSGSTTCGSTTCGALHCVRHAEARHGSAHRPPQTQEGDQEIQRSRHATRPVSGACPC